jgi:CHRD domain-containing protein
VLLAADVSPGQVTITNGEATFSRLNITSLSAANAQAIINNPAGYYFNVHTSNNPQGVIRGQLVKQ